MYAVVALSLLCTVWQYAASRAAGRFQRALLNSLLSMEHRSAALLASIRRLLDEQEYQRILRDAREAQIRLAEQEHAESIIDIGRVHDGQAVQCRRASECARDSSESARSEGADVAHYR